MNNLSAIGNIGKDAETRTTTSGKLITSFSFALTSGFGDKAETTWLNCSYWGERGKAVAQYLIKGTKIGVNGELTNRKFINKSGNEQYSLELNVSNLTLLGKKDDSPNSNTQTKKDNAPPSGGATPSDAKPQSGFDDFEEDIPF